MKNFICVTFAHLILLLGALYFQPLSHKISHPKKIAIKTVLLPKEKIIATIPNALPQVQPEQPAFAPKTPLESTPDTETMKPPLTPTPTHPPPPPTLKKETIPAPITPTPQKTPKAVPPPLAKAQKKEIAPAKKSEIKENSIKTAQGPSKGKKDQLISMVKKSLSSLEEVGSFSNKDQRVKGGGGQGKSVGPLASESLTFEAQYEQELIAYLQALLSFPEDGEVKVKLTLNRAGTVQNVEIVKTSSPKNKQYVDNALSSCTFPSFGSHFKGEISHTFILNLLSENSR